MTPRPACNALHIRAARTHARTWTRRTCPSQIPPASAAAPQENEEAALRVVWGVCAVALSNFGTTRDQDRALLAGEALPPTPGATTTALPAVAPPAPLDDDTALAVRFRLEKKLILAEAVQALGLRLRAVRADKELRERAGAGQAPKGAKPQAATGKGFGKQQQQKR